MLYHLFNYLQSFDFPGAGIMKYLSFRAGMAAVLSLIIGLVFGKNIIAFLKRRQIGETIRDLGLQGQNEKHGTPTMGGIIIITSILIPTLLFADLTNIYILLMLITTVWLGAIGFIDDYIKVFKHNKKGLHGKFKVLGQISLGIIVGVTIYFHEDIVIVDKIKSTEYVQSHNLLNDDQNLIANETLSKSIEKSTKTTIPFVKNNEFDYKYIIGWINKEVGNYTWILYILIVIFIITAVSNAANLTDGLDGLASGSSSIIGAVLGIFAWVSGNMVFADYLNIMYIPNVGELTIFISAFVGATLGFLWYNSHPAQIFMGDTGSLTLGGIIAVFAIIIRKELLIPLFCGIFVIEALSVTLQVSWFKITKKRFGEGRRIFLMSPLHHHYQKKGIPETKIVMRFFLVGIMLAILSIITLKIR